MRNFMTKLWHDKRGNAMIIAAAALPLLIGSAGLATDTIQWALWKRQLQRAADSAAIAGVYDRVAAKTTTGTAAAVEKDLGLNNSLDSTKFPLQTKTVTFPADDAANNLKNQVKVDLAVRRPLSFSSMFMASAPLIRTSATAAAVTSEGNLRAQPAEQQQDRDPGDRQRVHRHGLRMMTNSTSTNAAAAKAFQASPRRICGSGVSQSQLDLSQGYQRIAGVGDPIRICTRIGYSHNNCLQKGHTVQERHELDEGAILDRYHRTPQPHWGTAPTSSTAGR